MHGLVLEHRREEYTIASKLQAVLVEQCGLGVLELCIRQ